MITASHNPKEYNGVKMWNPDRIEWIGGERAADTLGSYPQKGKKVILSAWWD